MAEISSRQRPYQEVANLLRSLILERRYGIGTRLPPERELADILGVSRTVIREALIMLEIEGVLAVRRGAGVFIIRMPDDEAEIHEASDQKADNNAGPFEILQARQLLESNIAEFAAQQATREDIIKMRRALQIQEEELEFDSHETGDMEFHLAIAEATHNSMLVDLFKQSWQWRVDNPMWNQLHTHLKDTRYRSEWLIDHKLILAALVKKDSKAAKAAMWQHLENVKNRLLELSDTDDLNFDGYLFWHCCK